MNEIRALKVRAANRALIYRAKMDLIYELVCADKPLSQAQKDQIDNHYRALDQLLGEQGYE